MVVWMARVGAAERLSNSLKPKSTQGDTHNTFDTVPDLRREEQLRSPVSLNAKRVVVAIREFVKSRWSRQGLPKTQRCQCKN